MIVLDRQESALECTVCGELMGIDPRSMANEMVMTLRTAAMAKEHGGCERWAGDPQRAKAERGYTVRMRALMRELCAEEAS